MATRVPVYLPGPSWVPCTGVWARTHGHVFRTSIRPGLKALDSRGQLRKARGSCPACAFSVCLEGRALGLGLFRAGLLSFGVSPGGTLQRSFYEAFPILEPVTRGGLRNCLRLPGELGAQEESPGHGDSQPAAPP